MFLNNIVRIMIKTTTCVLDISDEASGTRKSELVNWYLKEMESEIDSEAELLGRKQLCDKVIYRLIHHVSNIQHFIFMQSFSNVCLL